MSNIDDNNDNHNENVEGRLEGSYMISFNLSVNDRNAVNSFLNDPNVEISENMSDFLQLINYASRLSQSFEENIVQPLTPRGGHFGNQNARVSYDNYVATSQRITDQLTRSQIPFNFVGREVCLDRNGTQVVGPQRNRPNF